MAWAIDLQDLVQKAKGGDSDAFGQIVERCTPRLERLIRSQLEGALGKNLELEDVVQETFLSAWRSIPRLRWKGEESFWAWLGTLGLHVIRDQVRILRAEKRDVRRAISLFFKEFVPGSGLREVAELLETRGASPSREVRRNERLERVRKAMSQLSPEEREIIFLVFLREIPVKEVARRKGRRPNTISMMLLRALRKLRSALGSTRSLHLPDRKCEEEDFGL